MTGLVKYYIDYLIMTNPDAHREFKNRLYGQFARIGKALSSPHRLEILELLEETIDRTEDVADVLQNVVLKNA